MTGALGCPQATGEPGGQAEEGFDRDDAVTFTIKTTEGRLDVSARTVVVSPSDSSAPVRVQILNRERVRQCSQRRETGNGHAVLPNVLSAEKNKKYSIHVWDVQRHER